MEQATWDAVDEYFGGLLLGDDPALARAVEAARAANLPEIAVAPNQGAFLNIVARGMRVRRVLEIGTLGGYSTIWLARALPPDGRLITLEVDQRHADVARANIVAAGLASIVDVRVGKALDLLPQIADAGEGPFDLVFIDADKGSNPDYFAWAMKLTRSGSLIVIDNVVRGGAVATTRKANKDVDGVRRLAEMMANEPRIDATVIQTVGVKGYDGLAFALVK